MRRAKSVRSSRGSQIAAPFYLPAPIGGLNTRDPRGMVPITEATNMTNCYPTTSGISKRPGTQGHTTGMPAQTETLMVYTTNSGTESMFAAAGTAFYDVTASGAVGAAVVSGLTNAAWEYTNFTNSSAATYLCCFNGADSPQYWDGTTWTAITGVSTPSITGLTTTTIAAAFVHQRRMWLVQANSLKVWYLPADSVGGAAKALDLGGVASKGGYVVAGTTWTVDGGAGLNDLWVVVTSAGQLIAYQGTDPSSSSSWVHVGTWDIPTPVGRRSFFQFKSDVFIITEVGIASARQVMRGDSTSSSMITDKIKSSYANAYLAATASSKAKWQMVYAPDYDLLIWCPSPGPSGHLYVLNAATGAWGGGWDLYANCMAVFNGVTYYADIGPTGTAGTSIRKIAGSSLTSTTMFLTTGFTDCGLPGVSKYFTLARIAGDTGGRDITGYMNLDLDYDLGVASSDYTIKEFSGVSDWLSLTSNTFYPKQNVGVNASLHMRFANTQTTNIQGFFVLMQTGGLLGAASTT